MEPQPAQSVTELLRRAADGAPDAAEDLLPRVYDELRALAESRLRRAAPGDTLQATALVHEAYIRLVGELDPGWQGRSHFFFAAARAMRDILVERARRKVRRRRLVEGRAVDPDALAIALDSPAEELLLLHRAAERLATDHPRKHEVVLLRFFAGLTFGEIAEVLGVTERTVKRDWRFTRAHLHRELTGLTVADIDEGDE